MANQQNFAQTLERACRERGWELLPIGIWVSWPNGRRQLIELGFFEHVGVMKSVRRARDVVGRNPEGT